MDRESRPPRADVPFPTQPPYTAFVGNMSFDCGQEEVKDFFVTAGAGLTVINVRMVTDFNGKSKGFCYAEFPDPEMLQKALDMTGSTLAGRNVRVSVAEPRKSSHVISLSSSINSFHLGLRQLERTQAVVRTGLGLGVDPLPMFPVFEDLLLLHRPPPPVLEEPKVYSQLLVTQAVIGVMLAAVNFHLVYLHLLLLHP